MKRNLLLLALGIGLFLLAGCSGPAAATVALAAATLPPPTAAATATPIPQTHTPSPSATPAFTPTLTLTPSITPTATADTRLAPDYWGSWPAAPSASPHALAIYMKGVAMGNNPHAFSVVGDCQSMANVFMGIYETDRYRLGDAQELQAAIDYFRGSFSRKSAAVKDGMSVASVLSPLWADPQQCQANETPVECELRVHKPALMFINLGTNWKNGGPTAYEKYLRQIVQIVIDHGTVPVLSTKLDNIEGDHSLNLATARVAYDMDIPLMNVWLAADDLPNHGLDAGRDNVYMTPLAWDRRNYTALVTLHRLWENFISVYDPDSGQPIPTP